MYYSVKQVAQILNKSEETIKRWLRRGDVFPNAIKQSAKQGWQIPDCDVQKFNFNSSVEEVQTEVPDETTLIVLAYQAVTLTSPTSSVLDILCLVGIKRTLEILLMMQQSPSKVKNPDGFIRKAIREGWMVAEVPQRVEQVNIQMPIPPKKEIPQIRFYNWLEAND